MEGLNDRIRTEFFNTGPIDVLGQNSSLVVGEGANCLVRCPWPVPTGCSNIAALVIQIGFRHGKNVPCLVKNDPYPHRGDHY